MDCTYLMLVCGEHLHWSDFWEQLSCWIVKNLMVTSITFAKGIKVTQVVAANVEPPVKEAPYTLEKLDEIQGIQ